MTVLRGATYDGSGSAAQSSWWRPDRIPRRTQNLLIVVLVAGIAAFFGVRMFVPAGNQSWPTENDPLLASPWAEEVSPTPGMTPTAMPANGTSHRRSEYAVGLHELRGFPPDVVPGSRLQIWVAWDPVITEKPQVQRLLSQATFVRWTQPFTEEGPMIAVLSVPDKRIGALMYGELYGQLGVTLPTT